MNHGSALSGLLRHFLLTLQLNVRSKQALIYGYLMPVFFLLAFGSVFRSDTPPLLAEMGQILTISILGGACLGLPTAIVAERERGVWRRYRLLPVPTLSLIISTLLARLAIIGSAIVIQIFLAHPVPSEPGTTRRRISAGYFRIHWTGIAGGSARRRCSLRPSTRTMPVPADDPDRRGWCAAGRVA